ncbi:MAG: hypothetical protein JWP09_801 [Candidatus Taylorbacteria bacterium]|nr:hypothetical protein [Candidatus Taylorbacteria bacterium]
MKKNTLSIFFKKFKHSFANIGSDADKDWKFVLSLFVLSLVISVIWHINVYVNIGATNNAVSGGATKPPINTKALGDMIVKYDGRAGEFQNIIDNKKVFIDPAR